MTSIALVTKTTATPVGACDVEAIRIYVTTVCGRLTLVNI